MMVTRLMFHSYSKIRFCFNPAPTAPYYFTCSYFLSKLHVTLMNQGIFRRKVGHLANCHQGRASARPPSPSPVCLHWAHVKLDPQGTPAQVCVRKKEEVFSLNRERNAELNFHAALIQGSPVVLAPFQG